MAKKAKPKSAYKSLKPKWKNFVDAYCVHYNAGRAYLEAGYTGKGARQSACALLTNPNVSAAVDERTKAVGITSDRITRNVAQIALEADPKDFAPFIFGQMTLQQLSDSGVDTRLIKSISVTPNQFGTSVKCELYSRQVAFDQLMKIRGMVIDKQQLEVLGGDLKGLGEAALLARLRATGPEGES